MTLETGSGFGVGILLGAASMWGAYLLAKPRLVRLAGEYSRAEVLRRLPGQTAIADIVVSVVVHTVKDGLP